MISLAYLVFGFTLLILGADKFVAGSSALACRLGLPPLIIGLTVVAFGTSAPELAVSISAGLSGSNEIVIGNVLGSNLFNLLVIAGLSALLHPLEVSNELLRRDWPFALVATALVSGLFYVSGGLTRWDGVVLLSAFLFVLVWQVVPALNAPPQETSPSPLSAHHIMLYTIGGLLSIVVGGQLAVDGAVGLAQLLSLSETFIGLTIVAMGTSLPELVTSIVATRRGEHGIAMGNIIGSNLFNLLFILGISSIITPISAPSTALVDGLLLLLVTALLFLPAYLGKFGRKVGALSLLSYLGYTVWILLR